MKRSLLWWLLPTLLVAALFTRLGWWQWQRAVDKEAVQALQAERAVQPAVSLEEALRQDAPRLRRVHVEGSYRGPTLLLDNQLREGRAGVLVFDLLDAGAAGTTLLVARGWLPLSDGVRRLPEVSRPEGGQALSGFLDQPVAAGLSLGAAPGPDSGDPRLLTRLDLDWLQQSLGLSLLPWVLYLDPDVEGGYQRDWSPRSLPPERHRGYAAQWWGLAAAVVVIYLVLAWRLRRRLEGRT